MINFINKVLGNFKLNPATNMMVGSNTPSYISHRNYLQMYNEIPELRIVVAQKVNMMLNGKLELVDADGGLIDSHPALDRLQDPNPLQNQEQFLAQLILNKEITGNTFVHKLRGTNINPIASALWVLPSQEMIIKPTGKSFNQSKLEDIIAYYEYDNTKIKQKFDVNDVYHIKNNADAGFYKASSPLESLIAPLSNISAAYQTRNILLKDMGAKGILSVEGNKDSVGALPIGNNPEKLEEQYRQKYGLGSDQSKIILSRIPVKWEAMSYPTKDLMLFEEIQSNFNKIADAYGLNSNIFSQEEGSTFNNVKESVKNTYQSTIIPEANTLAFHLTKMLNLQEDSLYLRFNYSHLPTLQENELEKSQAHLNMISGIEKINTMGIDKYEELNTLLNETKRNTA